MWTKNQTVLGQGLQVLSGRPPRMRPETVTVYRWECSCGAETTVINPQTDAEVKAFCCGKWVTLPEEMLPKKNLLTRLFSTGEMKSGT